MLVENRVGATGTIGAEIVAKALADSRVGERCDIAVVGPEESGVQVGESVGRWRPDGGAAVAGKLSGLAIERAVQMAMEGLIDGIVTAPIDKAALLAGGYDFPGHPEMRALLSVNGLILLILGIFPQPLLALCYIAINSL